jgi:arginyl-tRNA--protein-N-Asp/Glu arginylyltransferase
MRGLCCLGFGLRCIKHMYFHWKEQSITDFTDKNINSLYNKGFCFTRINRGVMHQTRSLRINLSKFELSSENKRILRKTEELNLHLFPLPFTEYHWSVGKMGKDFYEQKFGDGTFSANKIKELLTEQTKSNFNTLFSYSVNTETLGYCIARETDEMIHYCYPFYDLSNSPKDMGLGMMTRAVVYGKEQRKKYVYLGSAQRSSDTYKLQFEGIEWFDGEKWTNDQETLKDVLKKI